MNAIFKVGITLFWVWQSISYVACLAQAADPIPVPLVQAQKRETTVSIVADRFMINGEPTYKGRSWHGRTIEGLLLNSRMVQATFDDRNPETASKWAYPDTKKWDANRNTAEFIEMLPVWRRHGLLAVTLNLQGGSPKVTRRINHGTTRRSTATERWTNSI